MPPTSEQNKQIERDAEEQIRKLDFPNGADHAGVAALDKSESGISNGEALPTNLFSVVEEPGNVTK